MVNWRGEMSRPREAWKDHERMRSREDNVDIVRFPDSTVLQSKDVNSKKDNAAPDLQSQDARGRGATRLGVLLEAHAGTLGKTCVNKFANCKQVCVLGGM